MSFGGDLHTFDVFDLLGWLMGRKRAGILQMTRRSTKKRLAFRDGQVQWSSSNDPRETIGQALVREGLIQEEPLFRALLKQETAKDKRRLGEILIGDGLLTEPQLMKTLHTNALAHLYDLFLWANGRFDFDDERPPAPEASDLKIDLRPVLEEGPQAARAVAQAAHALRLERGDVQADRRPGGGHRAGAAQGPRPRRHGQDARRDQPRVAPLGVRDDAARRRAVRQGCPPGRPHRVGRARDGPGRHHQHAARRRGHAAQGGPLRRRERGLRARAEPRRRSTSRRRRA